MVQRKSTPRRSSSPKKRTKTKLFKVSNKTFKINVTTLKQIQKLQSSTKNVMPKLPFSRLIREILMQYGSIYHRIEVRALEALQEAAEIYLTQLFEDCNRCAMHARRITIKPNDMRLALIIRGCQDPGFTLQ